MQNNAKMGFNEWWVHLAMYYVLTVNYSVLPNGEPHRLISPSRGIKQGDPLSPYLYLICAEGLSALLRKAIDTQQIKGLLSC